MSSQAQIDANRANAQLSSGPSTPAGKAKSCLNAVKTGLTGRTVLLPGDDAAIYEKHIQRFFKKYDPADDDETTLVQSIADAEWRLLRIPSLEMGIYANGRVELAEKFSEEDETVRNARIDAQVFVLYQKQLNNLGIQETRLRKQRDKDVAELKALQEARKQRVNMQIGSAVELFQEAQREGKPFDPAEFGFEITMQQVHQKIAMYKLQQNGRSPRIAEILSKKAA